jgi:transposase
MEHVAIDLGGRQSRVCIRSSDGNILLERTLRTASIAEFLEKRPTSRVVVETCAEAFFVADAAQRLGHQVRVVPATLARSLLNVGARRTKRDEADARNISMASCRLDLGSVHIPSHVSRDRKTMCGMREALIRSRTMLINNVRGWLRTQIKSPGTGQAESFPQRIRALFPTGLPSYVERQLVCMDTLTEQIREADRELSATAKADPLCARLMSVPGVGPLTAVRFAAALDEHGRFSGAHPVESYLGLTPGEASSGDRQQRLSITKAGPRHIRWVLVQAAWSARRWRKCDPMVVWSRGVEARRGKKIAIVALARKIAGILYAIWRDGSSYDPNHRGRLAA